MQHCLSHEYFENVHSLEGFLVASVVRGSNSFGPSGLFPSISEYFGMSRISDSPIRFKRLPSELQEVIFSFLDPYLEFIFGDMIRLHRGELIRGPRIAVLEESSLFVNIADNEACGKAPLLNISRYSLTRILRRSSVPLERGSVFKELQDLLLMYLKLWIRSIDESHQGDGDACPTRLVTCDRVLSCLRSNSVNPSLRTELYGFGGPMGVRYLFLPGIRKILSQVSPVMNITSSAISVIHDLMVNLIKKISDTISANAASINHAFIGRDSDEHNETLAIACGPVGVDGMCEKTSIVHLAPTKAADKNRQASDPELNSEAETASAAIVAPVDRTASDPELNIKVVTGEDMALFVHQVFRNTDPAYLQSGVPRLGCVSMKDNRFSHNFPIPIEHIAMVAGKYLSDIRLTKEAAFYLSGIIDGLCGELIDLIVSFVEKAKQTEISERHISLAIQDNITFKELFPGFVRCAGVPPPPPTPLKESLPYNSVVSEFERHFISSLELGDDDGYFDSEFYKHAAVDPRDGNHYTAISDNGNGAFYLSPLPLLDKLCSLSASERQMEAIGRYSLIIPK